MDKPLKLLNYLKTEMDNTIHINYKQDFNTGKHQYRFSLKYHNCFIDFSREYIDDNEYEDIIDSLNKWFLIEKVTDTTNYVRFFITNQGIKIIKT